MPSLLGFIGPSFTALSPSADCEALVNLFPEFIDGGGTGKNKAVFYRTPGRRLFAELPTSPLRCLVGGDHRLFAVSGDTAYEVYPGGTYKPLGLTDPLSDRSDSNPPLHPLINDGNPAQIIFNGNQAFITSGQQGYITNDGGTSIAPLRLWQPDDDTVGTGDLLNVSMAASLDGYYVGIRRDSQEFLISDNAVSGYGGSKWDPLSNGFKQSNPDKCAAIIESHQELRILGTQTGEAWQDSGAPPPGSPLSRNVSGAIEQGIVAPWSLRKLDDESMMWLGGNENGSGIVWRATGYAPQRVSTHAIEAAIQKYGRIDDAVACTYQENGHSLYSLSFPEANATWVYDATIGLWHQRGLWNASRARYDADRARFHAHVWNKHFVGGGDGTGNIYEQSLSIATDAGSPIRWWRRAPHVNLEAKKLKHIKFTLAMETGVADQGTDPQVTLCWSNDGGKTWREPRTISSGKVGEYRKRVEWRQLGACRDRVYEVYGSDPTPSLCLVDAYLDVAPGNGA